ncbi:MAG: hypothetical protein ABI920_17205 [Casimicrobiaceae bacterium]
MRIDSGFRSGDGIMHFYDLMIAKVICHAETGQAATEVAGPATDIRFLEALLDQRTFRGGQVFMRFVDAYVPALSAA